MLGAIIVVGAVAIARSSLFDSADERALTTDDTPFEDGAPTQETLPEQGSDDATGSTTSSGQSERELNPLDSDQSTTSTSLIDPEDVVISPGMSIQSAVDSHPGGTTFVLMAGTHEIQTPIRPKGNQKFIGSGEVILTGSGSAQAAFEGYAADGVEVRGLIIERFDSATQDNYLAALHAGNGWVIVDNEIRHNTGLGVFHERDTVLRGNNIHHNRHSGIGGFKAHRSVIENNQIWENGAAQVVGESAGAKWVGGIDLVVRGNHAYRNYNNGLWLDSDNVNARVEGNLVEDNYSKGLHFEANCSGVIRNNDSRNNESGLFLVASSNTVVSDNTFSGNDEAIRVAHLDRGTGENCRWILDNSEILDNTVTGGMVRVLEHSPVPDPGAIFQPGNTRVTFDRNTYKATTFTFNGDVSWTTWQNAGNDPNGSYSP